jgi:hypothetical protein
MTPLIKHENFFTFLKKPPPVSSSFDGSHPMRQIRSRARAAVALTLAIVAYAGATATYDYKPGEFLVIDGGTSPDKKFSIVTGENKAGEFGVYLRDAHTKKLIGQLEEVATDLDSAPDAYHAHWAPDSKHVGITSRADRHWAINAIYRIENRRAYPVKTPELLCHAVPEFCQLTKALGGALTSDEIYADYGTPKPWKARQNSSYSGIVKWISPTRFVVSEESQWRVKERDPSATLGQYGETEKLEHESGESAALYHVWFDAEGECELLPNDKSQVLNTEPVKEQKNSE